MHGRCIAGSIIVFVPHRSQYSTRERRDIPTDFIGNVYVVRRSACLCPSVGCGYKASLAEIAEPIEPKLLKSVPTGPGRLGTVCGMLIQIRPSTEMGVIFI